MRYLLVLALIFCLHTIRASHVMGGEITWECTNGKYVFTLNFYRDCNGAEINTVSETIRVWNHPTLTSISLPFVERIDISPTCTAVTGGPSPLSCGIGNAGGNGVGATEKIVYRSQPITISGTPPTAGWIFTFENFSRSGAITNITTPSNYGTTIAAKMYAFSGSNNTSCVDSSPRFLQEPYLVSCAGSPFKYNMNAIDPDLDSLNIAFGIPYNNFPTGSYNPPTSPIPVPFEPGFSYSSPTPSSALDPQNIPASIDPLTGEINFTSFTLGNFVLKASVKSYREHQLIAEVEREIQLIVTACPSANNPPVIGGPFSGNSFDLTVNAGDLVDFDLTATDAEFLQDGTVQQNYLSASGPLFGTNFTSTSGCAIAPCATLNSSPIIIGNQGVTAHFNWQTSCDHLVGASGNAQDIVTYNFVFKVQDNFCQVPKVTYATITINVENTDVIPATDLSCVSYDSNGNIDLTWTQVNNIGNSFVAYEIYSIQSGLIATINTIGTTSYQINTPATIQDYYIAVVSGCNGNTRKYSDTISPLSLVLSNPQNGTAILNWSGQSAGELVTVYKQNPTSNWSTIGTTYSSFFTDTIDICSGTINYQISTTNGNCTSFSSISTDNFDDQITPDIPTITSLTIDTASNQLLLNWNVNPQPDTYGYVIYTIDANGFLNEVDTVWGILSTSYTIPVDPNGGSYSYTVAAFDSCFANNTNTYQTSAKANVHETQFLSGQLQGCSYTLNLNWTPYIGWNSVEGYEIWGHKQGDPWQLITTTNSTVYSYPVIPGESYCFASKAVNGNGNYSFSNVFCITILGPTLPDVHYLKHATVENNKIFLRHAVSRITAGINFLAVERRTGNNPFEEINRLQIFDSLVGYVDEHVDVQKYSYDYRIRIVDSCGGLGVASNLGKTILLQVHPDEFQEKNYLNWNSYLAFDGGVYAYNLYRGFNGNISALPIMTFDGTKQSYTDDLTGVNFNGQVCYYIEAIEGSNQYANRDSSKSNIACAIYAPLIYIPNSFMPDGVNKVFLPSVNYADLYSYELKIYDRLGQVLFSTKDSSEGWDGKLSGTNTLAEVGVYVYQLKINDGNGEETIRRGHVTLIR